MNWLKRSKRKGFTLVEVLVAFAVLAIVSGALLQSFVVSAKNNRRAYDLDKAHALCDRAAELFKAYPYPEDLKNAFSGPDFSEQPSPAAYILTESFLDASGKGDMLFTKYYDSEWRELLSSEEGIAAYRLKARVTAEEASEAVNTIYYPVTAGTMALSPSSTANSIELRLSLSGGNPYSCVYELSGDGGTSSGTCAINGYKIAGMLLPIGLELNWTVLEGIDPTNRTVTFYVDNTATQGGKELEAAIYVFGAVDGDGKSPNMELTAERGVSSLTVVGETSVASRLYCNRFAVSVTKLEAGGESEMFSGSAEKTFSRVS